MIQFPLKFMLNETISILMGHLLQLVISVAVTKPLLPSSLNRAIAIINFVRRFQKFHRRHNGLVEKYNVSLKKLLQKGIAELEFYGDLVYRFRKKNMEKSKRIGYNLNIIRNTAYLDFNPVTVYSYACFTLKCKAADRASGSMTTSS